MLHIWNKYKIWAIVNKIQAYFWVEILVEKLE